MPLLNDQLILKTPRYNQVRGPDRMTTPGGRIWNRLSDSDREILQPLIHSLYMQPDRTVKHQLPVFKHSGSYKAQWKMFEFGGSFDELCLVSSVSCYFLLAVPCQRRARLVSSARVHGSLPAMDPGSV